tara:strand:- start:93 stop:227 length:135 start_codon:yes stop_codon:yes gene_type:complete
MLVIDTYMGRVKTDLPVKLADPCVAADDITYDTVDCIISIYWGR